jgi:hypothetical protein
MKLTVKSNIVRFKCTRACKKASASFHLKKKKKKKACLTRSNTRMLWRSMRYAIFLFSSVTESGARKGRSLRRTLMRKELRYSARHVPRTLHSRQQQDTYVQIWVT